MEIDVILEKADRLFAEREPEKAGVLLREACEAAAACGDFAAELTLLNELIGYYRVMCRHPESLACCRKALELLRTNRLEGTTAHANTLVNAANAHRAAGLLDAAEGYYGAAIEMYAGLRGANDMRAAGLYNNLGCLYSDQGRYEDAIQAMNKALEIVFHHPDAVIEEATTYVNLVGALLKTGDRDRARAMADAALRIFETGGNRRDFHYSAALAAKAEVEYLDGNHLEAGQLYEQAAEELLSASGRTDNYDLLLRNAQRAYRQAGRVDMLAEVQDKRKE